MAPFGAQQDGVFASTCEHCGHFFKFRSVAPYKSTVAFTINGKHVTGKLFKITLVEVKV